MVSDGGRHRQDPVWRVPLRNERRVSAITLVSRDGSVEWASFGRFDNHPMFARILDRQHGGWFRVGPMERAEVSRRYLPETNVLETNVLETTFPTAAGAFTVTDCLPTAPLPSSVGPTPFPRGSRRLVRLIRVLDGQPEVEMYVRPRFSFGLTTAMVTCTGMTLRPRSEAPRRPRSRRISARWVQTVRPVGAPPACGPVTCGTSA